MDARWMLAALLTTACAPSAPPGLVLEGVLTVDDACTVSATSALRADGVLDTTALPDTVRPRGMAYAVAFRLRNYEWHEQVFPEIATPERILVNHVGVEVRRDGAVLPLNGLPNPFIVTASGALPWAPRGDSSTGIATATVLSDAYAAAVDVALGGEGDVELAMHVLATAADGTMRTSTTAVFPLHFCLGCLVTCAPAGTTEHASCFVGQDETSTVHCE